MSQNDTPSIYLGITPEGSEVLWNTGALTHLTITGSLSAGKSVLLSNVVHEFSKVGEVHGIVRHESDITNIESFPHIHATKDIATALTHFESFVSLCKERLENAGADHPPVLIALDDVQYWTTRPGLPQDQREMVGEMIEHSFFLLEHGKETNIHLASVAKYLLPLGQEPLLFDAALAVVGFVSQREAQFLLNDDSYTPLTEVRQGVQGVFRDENERNTSFRFDFSPR